jgi:hypothetical protein
MQKTEGRTQNTETHVHKTTNGPLIDTALYVMVLMLANPVLGQVGGDWTLKISTFLGPKWHPPNGSMPHYRAQKSLDFQGPPPTCSRIGIARIQTITYEAV